MVLYINLVVAVVLSTSYGVVIALPHNLARATVGLDADRVAELGEAKLKGKNDENKSSGTPRRVGAMNAVYGSALSCLGLLVVCVFHYERLAVKSLTSQNSQTAIATITSKRHYTTQGGKHKHQHYEASYWFEAVRADGMRCRVDVSNRAQPYAVWNRLLQLDRDSNGDQRQVLYLSEDPSRCRLEDSAKISGQEVQSLAFQLVSLCGLVFVLAGFYLGVVVAGSTSILAFATCALIWSSSVGCHFILIKKKCGSSSDRPRNTSIMELGMQEPADDLGDLSGTWLIESDLGKFEYKLTMSSPKATTVLVQGRPQGTQLTWEAGSQTCPEFSGYFMDGRQLTWEDDAGSSFVATFDGPCSFTGCARHLATSECVSFTGSRELSAV